MSKLRVGERISRLVWLNGPAIHLGPLPPHDHCGYEVAIQMILHSRLPVCNSKEYIQYKTIWKTRTAHINQVRASPQYNSVQFFMIDKNGGSRQTSNNVYSSWWFRKSNDRLCRHMSFILNKYRGLSLSLMVNALETTEEKILDSPHWIKAKHKWIVFSADCTVSYVLSLQGCKGLLLNLEGLRKLWDPNRNYMVIALLGRIKGETGDNSHLIPCVKKTGSRIDVLKVFGKADNGKERLETSPWTLYIK